MLSQITVTGTPARESSQLVRRAPWPTGRVSSAKTRSTLPCSAAAYTTPSAVPKNTVARLPALQCVRMRACSGTRAAPAAPIARFTASSSRSMRSTSSKRKSATSPGAAPSATRRFARDSMRAVAHMRFTAVGRAAEISAATGRSSARKLSPASAHPCDTAPRAPSFTAQSATAAAPAAPMAGAPRTASVFMASTTSRQLPVEQKRSSPGKKRSSR